MRLNKSIYPKTRNRESIFNWNWNFHIFYDNYKPIYREIQQQKNNILEFDHDRIVLCCVLFKIFFFYFSISWIKYNKCFSFYHIVGFVYFVKPQTMTSFFLLFYHFFWFCDHQNYHRWLTLTLIWTRKREEKIKIRMISFLKPRVNTINHESI